MTSSHNLDQFVKLYGYQEFIRLAEIQGPLSQDAFVDRLHIELDKIIKSLEEAPKDRVSDKEDRLTHEIVVSLRAAGYLADKDPMHGGHVDFLVRPREKPEMKWYGEAKIWHGVEYLDGGMRQLLSRYASGRERQLGFLVYFPCDALIPKMGEWHDYLKAKADHHMPDFSKVDDYSFISSHPHSSGAKIFVRHFAVNIHWRPEGKPRRKSVAKT